MTNRLPIPEELQHLIEKREGAERREAERRSSDETVAHQPDEQRSGRDRRQQQRRSEDKE